jgi:hypothetical protein
MLRNNENNLHKQSFLQDSRKNKVKLFFFLTKLETLNKPKTAQIDARIQEKQENTKP